MTNNDLISIIIPVYNSSKYLAETIESIENQTYQNYEAIFIDDGSEDNSIETIEKYKSKKNIGRALEEIMEDLIRVD